MIQSEVKSTIITLLSHDDAAVRRQAAEELSTSTSLMVSAVLSLALQDTDKGVRDSAARSLLQIRTKSVPYAVVEYLTDSSFITRNLASELMVKIGSDSIVPLLDYIHHENQDVRKLAIDTLGLIKDKKATMPLLTLLHDTDPNVVVAVVEAIGNICDESSIPHLTMAYVCYPYARVVIAEAIGKIGSPIAEEFLVVLLEELDEPEGEELLVVFSLIEALANVGNERALGVIVPLIKKTTGPLQHILLYAFVQIASRSNISLTTYTVLKSYFLNALLSSETKIVIASVQSLVQMKDADVEEHLISVLGRNDEVDAIILGNLQNDGKAFLLLAERYEASAFDQKKNIMGFIMPRVREISESREKEMISKCASLFDALAIDWADSDEEMRLLMVDALLYLDEKRACAFFTQLLEGMESWMRVTMVETIAGGSHGKINDVLLTFINDSDEEVRECVRPILNSRGVMIEDSEIS